MKKRTMNKTRQTNKAHNNKKKMRPQLIFKTLHLFKTSFAPSNLNFPTTHSQTLRFTLILPNRRRTIGLALFPHHTHTYTNFNKQTKTMCLQITPVFMYCGHYGVIYYNHCANPPHCVTNYTTHQVMGWCLVCLRDRAKRMGIEKGPGPGPFAPPPPPPPPPSSCSMGLEEHGPTPPPPRPSS